MALKRHHPGCSTGVDCACTDESECTLLYEPFSGEVPETLTAAAGAWDVDETGDLATPDAAALIRTTTQHSSAGMRAEALLKGTQPGDLLRVVICWLDADTYLAAELELNDCVLGDGVLRLIENGATVAMLDVADAVPDLFHRLRVCYDPGDGGSGGEDEDGPTLSALLTTSGHAVTGNQVQVQRKLTAAVGEATGRHAGLATGETLAAGAAFREFSWYDDGEGCPTCALYDRCGVLGDYFFRDPREQADPGCNWLVEGGAAPITEQSAFVSVCTLSAGATMVSQIDSDAERMGLQADVTIAANGSVRAEICRSGGDYLFARFYESAGFVRLQVGETIGGVENVVDETFSVGPRTGELHLCYDGVRVLGQVLGSGGLGVAPLRAQGGVTETANRGAAITAEVGDAALTRVAVGRQSSTELATPCPWCFLACSQCAEGELPTSVLVSISSDGSGSHCPTLAAVVLEAIWSPFSIYNPTCGEFTTVWDVSECIDWLAPVGQSPANVRVVYRLGEIFVQIDGYWGTLLHAKTFAPYPTCLEEHELPFSYNSGAWLGLLGNLTITVGPP